MLLLDCTGELVVHPRASCEKVRFDYLVVVVLEVELEVVCDSTRPIPTPPMAPARSPSKINVGRLSRMDLLLLGLDINASDESDD